MQDNKNWLDSKANVTKLYWGVWIACGLLLLAEPFVHLHPYFKAEETFGFYGIYGLLACVALVIVAKVLQSIVSRPEDYYDE